MSWEREASSRLPLLLESWLRTPAKAAKARAGVDLVLQVDGRRFAFEVKGTDDIATLQRAAEQLARYEMSPTAVKAVAVPYMGPKARSWAAESGVSWVDLSGNADVHADQLRIVVSGEKNRYATAGRPSNPFTPRYARVSRALLHDADRWWKQVELAHEVDVPSGTVSKVVQHLDGLELLSRNPAGELRATSPSLLLDSWAQRYRFAEHTVRKYHVPARSGSEALQAVAARLSEQDLKWAATGLSAAWLYTSFAGFRLNTFLVERHPVVPSALGLRPVDKGENVWLVVPKDDGAFYGMTKLAAWCAHPVQVYLDLLAHPERAAEAAQALREQRLTWRA